MCHHGGPVAPNSLQNCCQSGLDETLFSTLSPATELCALLYTKRSPLYRALYTKFSPLRRACQSAVTLCQCGKSAGCVWPRAFRQSDNLTTIKCSTGLRRLSIVSSSVCSLSDSSWRPVLKETKHLLLVIPLALLQET